MRQKIDTGIVLVTFCAVSAAHLGIVPALIAFEITKASTVGFWAYVVSVPVLTLLLVPVVVSLTAYTVRALGDDSGEWVTVQSESAKPRRVRMTKCTKGGKPDPELERYLYQREASRVGGSER